MRQRAILGIIIVAGVGLAQGLSSVRAQREPVYVGSAVCGRCHRGEGMGHQWSRWRLSKHARAYAALSLPEAKPIATLSGIEEEPQDSAVCLGCHATAADAEEWERDETFHIEDGVQCERCHGPGSEYMEEAIMKDRDAAMEAGLRMPKESDCLVCHMEKGSHVAVLESPTVDIKKGLERIDHPSPEEWESGQEQESDVGAREIPLGPGPKYVGVYMCAGCHNAPDMGYQLSRWQLGPHARAYARLAEAEAYAIAEREGIVESPQESASCLECHTTNSGNRESSGGSDGGADDVLPSFAIEEGVTCEACHGPGSEYAVEAIMRDPVAARQAGLNLEPRETCLDCHEEEAPCHEGGAFQIEEALEVIAHPTRRPEPATEEPEYKTPLNLAISPDSKELYVACEASDTVIVVDVLARRKIAEIPAGRYPTDVAFSPDGTRAYVSNRFDDTVSVIDAATREVVKSIGVGDDPHGVLADREGGRLYVLNTAEDSISVIDTESFEEVKRLQASRNPWSLALSPDGAQIFVTNTLSRFVEFRTPSISEVTVIDATHAVVEDRFVVPAANILQGVAWHPSGDFALVTLNRTKNLVPMTRLLQGWTITNGLGIIWKNGDVDQVLLDEPHLCFPDPADVAIAPDGRLALVTSSGSNRVAVVDVVKLVTMLEGASTYEREHVLPNHLGKPTEFVVKHIETDESPRGVVITPDGKTAFVTNALGDSLTAIDMKRLESLGSIDLGGSKVISKVRYGERLFHSANVTFHRQFSCHTCHPDGHVDGITYDIEPDGLGVSPVDNRTLRGILDTAPFKWEGTNPSLQRQCGPRLAVFFTRIQPFTPEELSALTTYIATITRPPNRYRPLGAELTPAQRRGKKLFERTMTNDGRVIPPEGRCVYCHPPPLHTNRGRHDVGTQMPFDRESEFDVPHLNNIYSSAPYLHNGIAETLEEIWTRFNPQDEHGVTNDMTKDELNDLIEFLKTL